MKTPWIVVLVMSLAACTSNPLPAPNSVQSRFDRQDSTVHVMVSDVQPLSAACLLASDGTRFPAASVSLVSGPHVDYQQPPSIGLGIGGFGFSRGGGFGTGVGVGVPLGGPTPSHVSDQCVGSAVIPVPPNYDQTWSGYRIEVQVGSRLLVLVAPSPAG
jgi:hypothetical protein